MVTFINVSIYFVGAIFFVINTKKCFMEKLSIPKAILSFLLSPSVGYFASYMVLINYIDGKDFEMVQVAITISVLAALLQLGIQLIMMFLYMKLMHAPNPSMSVFVYLCSAMLLPGFIYVILTESILPFILYFILHILFYRLTIVPASELTKTKQVTDAKLFVILPVLTFLFNSVMFGFYMYTFTLSKVPDNLSSAMKSFSATADKEAIGTLRNFIRMLTRYMKFQQDIILFPSIFIAIILIIAFSIIIRNVKYTNALLETQKVVKELSVEVMEALAHTIDAKDEYTKGHSIRVAKYSRMIANRMGLPEERCESIYYMGLLHDLGKIGVPNEIINKPSRLTEEEYDVIKTHPGMGSGILGEIKTRPDLVIGARWHHERYDGTGYPDHKKGEEIPLEARIIAVADTYDAMTSNRSYRHYLSQDRVREELEKNIGTQFDGKVARSMIAIIDEDVNYELHE